MMTRVERYFKEKINFPLTIEDVFPPFQQKVETIVYNLKNNKSTGTDGRPNSTV